MLKDLSQQEIVPSTTILEDLTNHLAAELSSDNHQLACVFDSEQPTSIYVTLEPPIEFYSAKSSRTSLSSDSGSSDLFPLNIMPL